MRKFKKGDIVKFGNRTEVGGIYTTSIPSKYIIHGNTGLGDKYYKEWATVVARYKEYYAVKFWDNTNKYTQLGFLEEYLELVKITNWEDEFNGNV